MSKHNSSEYIRLKELGSSKFEVAKNEYDIRGWTVKNSQGRILGKVNDLLFDKESEKVLYMVIDLDGNEMHLKDRKVLAPLNIAEINEAYKNVVFPGVMANELTELPTYEKGKISTRVEDIVQHAFANTGKGPDNSGRETDKHDNYTEGSSEYDKASMESAYRQQEHSDTTPHTRLRSEDESRSANLGKESDTHENTNYMGVPSEYDKASMESAYRQQQEHSDQIPQGRSRTHDESRPQTVVGVFEHSNQGQVAIEYLLDHNFRRNQIEVSSRASEYREGETNDEDHSITNWFKSVFGNDDDARKYSEAAKTGCVITVHTSSMDEAERAAEILDKHGALKVEDSLSDEGRGFRSRILDRKDANSRWGR